jgi:hypothetical protein
MATLTRFGENAHLSTCAKNECVIADDNPSTVEVKERLDESNGRLDDPSELWHHRQQNPANPMRNDLDFFPCLEKSAGIALHTAICFINRKKKSVTNILSLLLHKNFGSSASATASAKTLSDSASA